MISGIMMAITASDPSPGTGYKTMSAATLPKIYPTPIVVQDTGTIDLSEDLVRDLAKRKGVLDTVYITKTDTIKEQVTKVKVKKVPVPSNIMELNVTARTDTVHVPVYYLATQVGNKEGPKDECISVYEVHKVDEICPKTTTSSTKPINESDIDVGE
jgi:hypothetical protein